MNYGDHTPYILWSYGISAAALVALVLWSVLRLTGARKKLDEVEGEEKDDTK